MYIIKSKKGAQAPFLFYFLFYPRHEEVHYPLLLAVGEINALSHPIPFFQAASAAAGTGVLGDENGMSPHGGLLSVVFRRGGSKADGNEILCVDADGIKSLFAHVVLVLCGKVKSASEIRLPKAHKSICNCSHEYLQIKIDPLSVGLFSHIECTIKRTLINKL